MNMRNRTTWELTHMKKALSSPVSLFLNTEEDNIRLMEVKRELKRRRHSWKLLQIIKLPLTILDILFPDATIKLVKQISLLCSTTNYNPTTTEEYLPTSQQWMTQLFKQS